MKAVIPLLLATSVNATPIDKIKIPMTQELVQTMQAFIMSNVAVCEKRKIEDNDCAKIIESKIVAIRKKANEVCKDYPKEAVPCLQYGLNLLMNADSQKNVIILNSKDV